MIGPVCTTAGARNKIHQARCPKTCVLPKSVCRALRCVRTDGRVKLCGKIVPTLVEPHTFVQWVLKEEHSHQTSGHGAGI